MAKPRETIISSTERRAGNSFVAERSGEVFDDGQRRRDPAHQQNEWNASNAFPEVVIRSRASWQLINVREIWRARELLLRFVVRDIKLRYKQTFFGAAWAVLQPLMMLLVFTAIFSRMGKAPGSDVPYPVFVFCGLLPWLFFSRSATKAASCIIGSQGVIQKVYFPRLIVPFSSVGAAGVDFFVAFSAMLCMMLYYGIPFHPSMALVPVLLCLTALAALGIGTFLAALNVAYRDFVNVLPFLLQVWMLATPAIYLDMDQTLTATAQEEGSSTLSAMSKKGSRTLKARSAIAADAGRWIDYNPLMGLIASFRSAVLGRPVPWSSLAYSTSFVIASFLFACFYFRRQERTFADIL